MGTDSRPELQQICYRPNPDVYRFGRKLATINGESLAAMSRRLLEDYVRVELGIDSNLTGSELDLALLEAEIGQTQEELAKLEAERTSLTL